MDGEDQPDAGRQENDAERADRNFTELLQELRVAQTGVQILFAFLLATAYTQPMQRADGFAHWLLAADLLAAASATALLIAPVALHRWLFRRHVKDAVVATASGYALAGLLMLMLAVSGGCLLALDGVLGRTTAAWISAGVLALLAALWVVVPLAQRRRLARPR